MKRFWKVLGIVFGLFLLLVCSGLGGPFLPLFVLLFGWIYFPIRTLPEMTFEPAALVVGGVALVLFIAVAHGLCRWLYSHFQAASATPRPWRLRWTASVVMIVILCFASSIGMIVVIHETGWLVTANKPIISSGREAIYRLMSQVNQLKQIGLATYNYAQVYKEFPPGGTISPAGEPQHSWETMILPYLEGEQVKPNMNLPWNHPDNATCFKTEVRQFLNPGVSNDHRANAQGYALSHYSVNSHVLGLNRGIRDKEVPDGTSTTILGGEINDRFPAWGYPINWRDPALGINKSPDGFGGPWSSRVANFLFMDGSVRFLSETIDPKVLQAISTPAGGEKIPDQDW